MPAAKAAKSKPFDVTRCFFIVCFVMTSVKAVRKSEQNAGTFVVSANFGHFPSFVSSRRLLLSSCCEPVYRLPAEKR